MPSMVMGMAPLHKPGTEVGQNAIRALTSVWQRGHPAKFLAGDRAYTQATPEHFQLSARALGYDLVLDYKIDQLGLQGSYEGMNLVDGSWYCPAMPTALVNATLDFRNDLIDEVTHAARIRKRRAYQMRPKASPTPTAIPASLPGLHARPCGPLRTQTRSEGKAPKARPRTPVTHILRIIYRRSAPRVDHPSPRRRRQVPPALPHEPQSGTPYATLRNSIEGMNGYIKDGAREAADDPERRRIRGAAAQSVFVAFLLFAANIRKINEFLKKEEPRPRRSASLSPGAGPSCLRRGPRNHPRSRPRWYLSPSGLRSRCLTGTWRPDPPLTA